MSEDEERGLTNFLQNSDDISVYSMDTLILLSKSKQKIELLIDKYLEDY